MRKLDYIAHFGIKGQKWGIRRYQNKDGTLTEEGRRHYSNYNTDRENRSRVYAEANKLMKSSSRLSRDFGGKAENVDDLDFLGYTAKQYSLNTKAFDKAMGDYNSFRRMNSKSIATGEKLYKRSYNENYSYEQRKRDQAIYGRRGMERINKEMHRGNSIQGARHYEAARRQRKEERGRKIRMVRRGAEAVGGAALAIGVFKYQTDPGFRSKVDRGARNIQRYFTDQYSRMKTKRNLRKWGAG